MLTFADLPLGMHTQPTTESLTTSLTASKHWLIEDFVLDRHARLLHRGSEPVALGARAFDLLCVFAERSGQTVTKHELLERVWPKLIVEENNLHVHVSTLRKLMGSDSIRTVSGLGYCFTKQVHAQASAAEPAQPSLPPANLGADSALKRSVAVLPFANLSGDRDNDYFSDGLAEDIIAHLTRSRWLFVTSRNSSFTYRGEPVAAKRVAQEMGVRYVVYGTVRRAAHVMRVTAELVDGVSGDTLWANRYDRAPNDLFAVQDEISSAITSAIEPVYLHHESQNAKDRDANSLAQWELVMRARWHFWRSGRDHVDQAGEFLAQAIKARPQDSGALALMAFVHLTRVWAGWATDLRAELAEAMRVATLSVRADDSNPSAHFALGTALSVSGQSHRAVDSLKLALNLYPQFAAAAGELGRVYAFMGLSDEAHEYALQAIDASPHDPHLSLWLRTRGIADFVRGEHDSALKFAREAAAKRSDWFFNHYLVAACAHLAGDSSQAEAAMQQASEHGKYSPQMLRFGHPFTRAEDSEKFNQALKALGWQG